MPQRVPPPATPLCVDMARARLQYDAPAKREIGWAFWWLTVVLFCLFSALFAGR